MLIQDSEKNELMERRLWAYPHASGWIAVDPADCDFDEDRVAEATAKFEATTKPELIRLTEAAHFEIAMWLD